jgi:hypothetical protein
LTQSERIRTSRIRLRAAGGRGEHGQRVEGEPAWKPDAVQAAALGVVDLRDAALEIAHLADVTSSAPTGAVTLAWQSTGKYVG